MSHFDEATLSAARALIAQYGDDAEIIATLRAAEFAAMNDVGALEAWDSIISCLGAMAEGAAGGLRLS